MRPVTCLCGTALLSLVTSGCGPRGDARAPSRNPCERTLVGVAAVVTALLPHDVRNWGALATIGIAALLVPSARGALLKPAFLVMVPCGFTR